MRLVYSIGLFLSLTSVTALAEKKLLKVEGMHCKGCVEMLEGEVCEVQKFKSCKVRLAKGKKNLGEIELETEGDAKVDMAKVKEKIQSAGAYKIIE